MTSIIFGLFGLLIALMTRPGVNVFVKDQPPPTSAPTDTGVWFVVGLTEKGPTVPTKISSMAEYVTVFGQRVSYGLLYDALDVFFREGGRAAYLSRVVGPANVTAFKNLLDAGAGVSLIVRAKNTGAWGNNLKVAVVAGTQGYPSTWQIQISDASNVILEQSGDLVTQQDAINWSLSSLYVNIVIGATTNIPALLALAALATGNDDQGGIIDATWQSALDAFVTDLGPGQVSMPGQTALARQNMLLAHAQPHNRVALVDQADSGSRATLVSAAVALRGINARFAATFAPWAVVPGITPGTFRTVPMCAVAAGIMARNDVENSANVPSAGDLGISNYIVSLSQVAWTDADRELLNNAGVNVVLNKYGTYRVYGYRTLVNYQTDAKWVDLGGVRMIMEISALGGSILEAHLFDQIDGQGKLFSIIDGELTGMLNQFYTDGSLYGATPEEAYNVEAGTTVNTPQTIANRELHAVISLKTSPMAEFVELDLVKVAVTDSVS